MDVDSLTFGPKYSNRVPKLVQTARLSEGALVVYDR